MDREYYKSLARAYQSIYEGAGAAASVGGQVLRQGGKIGSSLALQKLQNWPEYRQYRDQGYSESEAAGKIASRLGLNVAGSVVGGALAAPAGPWASAAAGTLTGPMVVQLMDALDDEKTQKQKQYESGVVWDDKSGKYVYKPQNLTQGELEADEDFNKRVKEGQAMAKELNSVKGGPQPPTWLEYERRREKERRQAEQEKSMGGGTMGPSKNAPDVPNYTVGGIEYDGNTGRPVNPPPTSGSSGSSSQTDRATRDADFADASRDRDPEAVQDAIDQAGGGNQQSQQSQRDRATRDADFADASRDRDPEAVQDAIDQATLRSGGGNQQSQQGKNKDGSNVTQTGANDDGLTPFQQWAKNFPLLAKKVKPGQAGYDEIQQMVSGGSGKSKTNQQALKNLRQGAVKNPVSSASMMYKQEKDRGNQQSQQSQSSQNNNRSFYADRDNTLGQDWDNDSGDSNNSDDDDAPMSRLSRMPRQSSSNTPTSSGRPASRTLGQDIRDGASAARRGIERLQNSRVGRAASSAASRASDAARSSVRNLRNQGVRNVAGQAADTVADQAKKGASALNNAVRNRLNRDNE